MQVISLKALRDFWTDPKSPKGAEAALRAWFKVVSAARWCNFAELRRDFRSTDKVGDCYVFDVANNNIRLIAFIRYATATSGGTVFVKKVMTHPEYDKNTWPDECGCHKSRPKTKGPRPVKGARAKRGK